MTFNDKNDDKKMPKKCRDFFCIKCDFTCSKISNYKKHLATRKHKINDGELEKMPKNVVNIKKHVCENCGNEYKYRQGLHTHKKKCYFNNKNTCNSNEISYLTNIIIEMVKSNNELQKQVLDVCKVNTNNYNNNTINSNNKTFNLQFFLNEQCKDAMNISDFVNSVSLSLDDLEKVGTLGYVNGISSIIIKELNGLDITKRPVHCSDAKRETLYIKDEDKWEKECPENTKIKKVIKNVETKNIKLINEWTIKHPNFINSTSHENDEYLNIMKESMGGKGDYEENKNKIIKKIAKEVIIEK